MKKTITSILFSLMISTGLAYAAADTNLEPCINGAISASGSFSSQTQEDDFYQEPCIDGSVSADGLSS